MRRCTGVVVLAGLVALPCAAEAASCRGYPRPVIELVKSRVEAVRMIEREAADRLVGLDTRTFPFLAGESRKAGEAIASRADIEDEANLKRCRNLAHPIRTICRSAALFLATALEEQEGGAAQEDTKAAYTANITHCEQLMRLPPMSTAIRISN